MIVITDEDIEKVEQKFGLTFDEESREFIKCLESKDIKACPGAGKTTSLGVKLNILSNYMPFEDNSGILVLTHTNVAVDEIKSKLGINAQKVLSYPNHVGTFQSFINKYLAIPMYIKLLKKRPERIDDTVFDEKLLKLLKWYYLDEFILKRSKENKLNIVSFLKKIIVEKDKIILPQRNKHKVIVKKEKRSYVNLKRALQDNVIKKNIINGYLSYSHSYQYAEKYLNDYPQIVEVFQKRFKYVFIDEAQDTNDKQFEILNKLFSENSIIQKIGDNNQAIFNPVKEENEGWKISNDSIEIKNTKRLSSLISKQVMKVAIEPQALNGKENITIQPTIILFDNPKDVLPKFGDLIIENGLHHNKEFVFKAVGAVKEHHKEYAILDYFPDYQQSVNIQNHDTLVKKLKVTNKAYLPREYKNIILSIFVDYLKEQNILNSEKKFTQNGILFF